MVVCWLMDEWVKAEASLLAVKDPRRLGIHWLAFPPVLWDFEGKMGDSLGIGHHHWDQKIVDLYNIHQFPTKKLFVLLFILTTLLVYQLTALSACLILCVLIIEYLNYLNIS